MKNLIIVLISFFCSINLLRKLQGADFEECYSRIVHIAKQLIEYEKETGIKIF